MSVHEIEQRAKIRVVKSNGNADFPDTMDEELRRLVLAMHAVLKRRYPNDFRRIMRETDEAKAA